MKEKLKKQLKNIPNIISCIRIALVFVFEIFFINSMYFHGLVTYGIAFLSDLLDGYLARRFNWVSDVGKLLDPFADKLMLVSALVCFAVQGIIPMWILILAGTKEVVMCVCGIILYNRGTVVQANFIGKLSTGLWTLAIVANILAAIYPSLSKAAGILIIVAAIFAVGTGFSYAIKYFIGKNKEKA